MGEGGPISSLACNGISSDLPAGMYQPNNYFGTLFVHHGCTLYVFSERDWMGDMKTFVGPLSDFLVEISGDMCHDSNPCYIKSMIVECQMTIPDCQPSDEWQSIAYFDNTGSFIPTKFTYHYQIGTEWSSEISQGFDIDYSVTSTIKASFFRLFEAEDSSSFSTGYNWQSTSYEAKSEVTTYTIETEVPPGTTFKIEQAQGLCGNSEVRTEMFRTTEDTKTGDWKIFYH